MTRSAVTLISRPAARARGTRSAQGRSSSMPSIRPRPRISTTPALPVQALAEPVQQVLAHAPPHARPGPPGCRVSMTVRAARQASGLPPKVDPWVPGAKTSAAGPRARQAPMGTPLASPLARVMTSGLYPAVLVGEGQTGASHAGLDLVEHEQPAVGIAQGAQARQVVRRRDVDPALALDRLDQDGGDVVAVGRGRLHRGDVVVGDAHEALDQGLEAGLDLAVAGGAQGGQGAAVKAAVHDQDGRFLRRPCDGRAGARA